MLVPESYPIVIPLPTMVILSLRNDVQNNFDKITESPSLPINQFPSCLKPLYQSEA